jgi:HAD superfamily hydrolase (TIGR01450 family)
MPAEAARDAQWAFEAYEKVRHRLPAADFPPASAPAAHLEELAEHFDVFLLDAFGVLNIGEEAIPGVPERIAALQAAGRRIMVVSNAAGYPKRVLMERYARLGYDIAPENILCSREVLLDELSRRPHRRRGLMASRRHGMEELEHLDAVFLGEDPSVYDEVEEFLFLGSGEWTQEHQALLEASLRRNPRPVLVGNPDIVAPREGGLSREPGHFAHRLADVTGVVPEFFGKPFPGIFRMALARLALAPDARVVMVGDTLQTDILGGRAAGLATALVSGYGALAAIDHEAAIRRSGIVPDFILPRP